ncbi:trehalose-6-phosphate synthase [Archangium violaceum]|uniref:alpha,alpha-trehalose-phosphate synthase (UDP-forming) n=1 Tax=Archangium violaceum TaxID=83451 RepID=UPI0019527CCC|nr:trehalose-6-phosphate synthase [Archangium violaceum]QRN99519.1 trehalose-6-phosphate synthase [Archangium violaceum]
MSRSARFVIALVVGLALLTGVALFAVTSTTRAWFEKDIQLRAELAVSGARDSLLERIALGDGEGLARLLGELTRDERIMAAAVCDASPHRLASTPEYPEALGCGRRSTQAEPERAASKDSGTSFSVRTRLEGGEVQANVVPLLEGSRVRGFVILVHDLSWVQRREGTTQSFLLVAFAILAIAAPVVTLIAARMSWRGWSEQLRRLLQGVGPEDSAREFQPILRDVRELVERLHQEREQEGEGGTWTANRLKSTLSRHLSGERVIIVANREPYIHQRAADGGIQVSHPASGLVTALEPVMRACSGVWVAHGSGSADRETADAHGRIRVPPGEQSYTLRRVWLSKEEEQGYYYGFANEGLWPLCHIADTRPLFRAEDWRHYREVNRRFADAVCEEVEGEDPVILVQDYHFALAPRMIRERLPRATIITFWHIPWPNSERFGICPWRVELLEGMLGASILGFHTQAHCNNFLDAVDRFMEARLDREQNAVVHRKRQSLVRPYPISIEWPSQWAQATPPTRECRASVLAELGLPPDTLLGVGVDRLDYTKGIEERLQAVERTLERAPHLRGRLTFVQLAAPSRTVIERYRQLNASVEVLAERINQRFGTGNYRPIILLRAHHEPLSVFRYYRAADFCYVSSLHDGMNLVAKEFIAAREDEQGVLVLSHFTGAARELTEALIVNPYDLEEASAAILAAVEMPREEQAARMRSLRAFVAEFNVYRWAGRMLVDAARLRQRDRLNVRLPGRGLNLLPGGQRVG